MNPTRTPVIVMAKAPRPGRVKTRLAVSLGADAAARLARAFLQDTWHAVSSLPWATPVLAGDSPDMGVDGATVWPQGEGDLGERLERVLSRALEDGTAAIVIGGDTPGLPVERFEWAREALTHADAVVGPSDDGGFHLLGLRRCAPGTLRGLPWSDPRTHDATCARLRARGMKVSELPGWFDVDEEVDLDRLQLLLDAGLVRAPATSELLRLLRPRRLRPWVASCP